MDKKIALIGDAESIKGFAAIGFDTFPTADVEEAGKLLRTLADGEIYAVLYLTENYYTALGKEIARSSDKLIPAILPIPSSDGGRGIGAARLSSFVEKAVGSDIIFKE